MPASRWCRLSRERRNTTWWNCQLPAAKAVAIAEVLFSLLDDFRAFRHVYSRAYTFELDWERERLVAQRFPLAAKLLHQQLEAFLDELEAADN